MPSPLPFAAIIFLSIAVVFSSLHIAGKFTTPTFTAPISLGQQSITSFTDPFSSDRYIQSKTNVQVSGGFAFPIGPGGTGSFQSVLIPTYTPISYLLPTWQETAAGVSLEVSPDGTQWLPAQNGQPVSNYPADKDFHYRVAFSSSTQLDWIKFQWSATLPLCGDGKKEGSEQCDDGNLNSCDGCDSSCRLESCGNNRKECSEECDGSDSSTCTSGICLSDCTCQGGGTDQCGDLVCGPTESCSSCPQDCGDCGGQKTTSLSQYGITWYFDKEYTYGQFANGDYWVIGPAVIMGMSPNFTGTSHGWEVNPVDMSKTGFDNRLEGFDPSFVPSLPYAAQPGQSIVKAISLDNGNDCRVGSSFHCLQTAAVLTVVFAAPPNNGATVFRPPYVGSAKPYYSTTGLRTDLLPSFDASCCPSAPTLDWVASRFKRVQLDDHFDWHSREYHPQDNMPDYGSKISRDVGDGVLRLMLNDPLSQKMPGIIGVVQYGIDVYHMRLNGLSWRTWMAGHSVGRELPMVFAAVMLDNASMEDFLRNQPYDAFPETESFYFSTKADNGTGKALWGDPVSDDFGYWRDIVFQGGNKIKRDPYKYIDGGIDPGGSYQRCCTSESWQGHALAAFHLMPSLGTIWNYGADFHSYTDRWVVFGAWTQPDPCAPATDTPATWPNDYGKKYGPDPQNPGECIHDTNSADGVGRFPSHHGTGSPGDYDSAFVDEMWAAYHS